MRKEILAYFLISCFLVVFINLRVQASELKLVAYPGYVETPAQCGSMAKSYNHYAYQELPRSLLEPIGNGQMLHRSAAKAFAQMKLAAKKDGITLIPVSGFRSIEQQQYLFYEVAKQRKQTLVERAKLSAPPGYSQHHTGFAMDINSLEPSFENTKAFAWLRNFAEEFGFKLSFARNNAQGVSYEPWHWAWYGSEEARFTLHEGCI